MSGIAEKPLVLRDEIHGDMSFDHVLRRVIDHESVQRLRYIKQLGLAEYVFPCATHTRFQHSLGASYLAGRYFKSLLKSWQTAPFLEDLEAGESTLLAKRTRKCVSEVAKDAKSVEFWWQVVSLAGLLHDVGHGPWSHSFEHMPLKQDFTKVIEKTTGAIRNYFDYLTSEKRTLWHEDISVLYVAEIFRRLETEGLAEAVEKFALPVATLVNKKMLDAVGPAIEKQMASVLSRHAIKGGTDFHKLLRPIISGPFDVDRIDYIQRDGRNCGVPIGGIEWRRIVSKVIPCLARYEGRSGEARDVVLISNFKNQHVLDDFIFSLFQMYAQVYMHPKIVGFEELFRRILEKKKLISDLTVTFEMHSSLNDERFRDLLRREFGADEIDRVLFRKHGSSVKAKSYPKDAGIDDSLEKSGYSLIDTQDRPMMKDSAGVFLFSSQADGGFHVLPWVSVSPLAQQFYGINYSPRIWMKIQ